MSARSVFYINQMQAEAHTWQTLRMGMGACVGLLHEHPSDEALQEIRDKLERMFKLLDSAIGIRQAGK